MTAAIRRDLSLDCCRDDGAANDFLHRYSLAITPFTPCPARFMNAFTLESHSKQED